MRVVKDHFGVDDIDLMQSNLYTRGREKFEMWQPNYGTDIYYNIDKYEVNVMNLN